MAARIEDAFGLAAATDAHSPAPQGATSEALQIVSSSDRRTSDEDYNRERAITSTGLEVEMHLRLRDDAQRRYAVSSCLLDLADADRHLVQAREAAELMRALQATREGHGSR